MTEPKPTYIDNRLHIEADPVKIQTWELIIFEDDDATTIDIIMILARYLANADGLVSPDLPSDPVDELTKEQRMEIKNSKAYKAIKRFHPSVLKQTAREFGSKATEELDPN